MQINVKYRVADGEHRAPVSPWSEFGKYGYNEKTAYLADLIDPARIAFAIPENKAVQYDDGTNEGMAWILQDESFQLVAEYLNGGDD